MTSPSSSEEGQRGLLNIFVKLAAAGWCFEAGRGAERRWRVATTPNPSFEKEGDSR